MRDNAEIEVRWTTKKGEEKSIVIKHRSKISAIMLKAPEELRRAPVPPGPEFESVRDVAAGDGPLVCYEINGQMHCW